jgi:hypothetical protein
VLHEKAPWLSPTLNDWFQHACAREPAQRFASAEAMIEALMVASGLSATRLSMVEGGVGSVVRPTPPGAGTANIGGAPAVSAATGGVPQPVARASQPYGPPPAASGSVGTSSMTVAAGVPRRGFLIPVLVIGFGLVTVLSVLVGVMWWRKRSAASDLANPPASVDLTPPVDTAPPAETASSGPVIEPAPSAAGSAPALPSAGTTARPDRPQGGGYVRPPRPPPPKPPKPPKTPDPGF